MNTYVGKRITIPINAFLNKSNLNSVPNFHIYLFGCVKKLKKITSALPKEKSENQKL